MINFLKETNDFINKAEFIFSPMENLDVDLKNMLVGHVLYERAIVSKEEWESEFEENYEYIALLDYDHDMIFINCRDVEKGKEEVTKDNFLNKMTAVLDIDGGVLKHCYYGFRGGENGYLSLLEDE